MAMQYVSKVLIIFLLGISFQASALTDSIGLKIFSNNKVFIVHKVEKGQGLYSIAKHYHVEVQEIEAYNPEVKSAGLKVDQYIFIPTNITPEKARELIAAADKRKEEKENGTSAPRSREDNVVYYTVKAGETLFSISRLDQCKFTIDELKRWNNMKTNDVKEGQKLIVAFREEVKVPVKPVEAGVVDEVIEGKGNNSDTTKIIWSDVTNVGLATWIPDAADFEGKSYALYSKAKIGTIIRVENLANHKATYVKVIGPLAGDEKKDVIIVLTETAAKSLEASDSTFRVELIYSNDEL
ncbi:LysM peptidoglycan-binding domain-containing protein [bacterium]|nr:LysM peptidoglycan-binding domain-containing protein [bacterium]